jgi:tRNA (guanine37-N1)-methyltransferase
MVLRVDIVDQALHDAYGEGPRGRVILLAPSGRQFDDAIASELAGEEHIALLCGRYEGVDERVIEARGLEEISVGDYVLSGGEIAAMALIDACVRLLPGVMGKEASGAEESFAHGLLEYPQYTRPMLWEDRAIPEILLSGDHAKIAAWRRAEAERLTRERRPDLLTRTPSRKD